ncbi:MAG: phage major capsid protein [Bacteroidetes bacterium]|nr:phage major capsid protein [Bacteroidota bacterium]
MAFKKIQEYISTGDGLAGTLLIPKLIMPTLIEETDKNLLDRGLAAFVVSPAMIKGNTFEINLETPDTGQVREVAEGAEVILDAQAYETVTFTPVKYGMAIRITREMMEDSQFELLQSNIRNVGKRLGENETRLVLEALEGASTTVAGGAAVTIANVTTAMLNVEAQDYTPTDLIVGTDVLNDLRNIDTFAEADKWGDSTNAARTGKVGMVYGLFVHLFSNQVGTSTTAYVIDRSEAYGIAIKRDITVENTTLPSFDMEGAVVTQRLDIQLLRNEAVGRITTS